MANNAEGDAQAAALEAAQDRLHSQDHRLEGRGEADACCLLTSGVSTELASPITPLSWAELHSSFLAAKATCWRHLLVAPRCSCSS